MFWLILLIAVVPELSFNGLTLEKLYIWFNIHPFLFVAIISITLYESIAIKIYRGD